MDHEWGRNITEQGLGQLGATMCAYMTDQVPGWFLLNVTPFPGFALGMRTPLYTGLDYYLTGAFAKLAPGPFPYGRPVTADAPV